MAIVFLGNTAHVEAPIGTSVAVNGESAEAPEPVASATSKTVVQIVTPDFDGDGNPVPLDKKLTEVRNAFGVHSSAQAAWVEGHEEFFNQAVAQVFGCPVGRPSDWDAPESTPEPVSGPPTSSPVESVEITATDVTNASEVLS